MQVSVRRRQVLCKLDFANARCSKTNVRFAVHEPPVRYNAMHAFHRFHVQFTLTYEADVDIIFLFIIVYIPTYPVYPFIIYRFYYFTCK